MNEKKMKIYEKFFNKIEIAEKILIISHKNPDGDTLGSSTGLKNIIDSIKSNKKVDIFCVDKIPEKLAFIPGVNNISNNFSLNYDLFIFVDIASKAQTGLENDYPLLFDKKSFNTVSIDHHISNELFAKQNILIANYPSTTSIIYEIAKFLKLKIFNDTATSLLTGIMTDTGNFMHSNTTEITYQYAGELIELGGDKQYILNNFFKKNDFTTLKTWGQIFSNAFLEKEIVSSYITKKELDFLESNHEKISGALDYLNTTENIKLSTMIYEKEDIVKGSLRTLRDDIDVSKLAKKYGGGGHKKAAGFSIKGKILVEKTINFEEKN